MKCLLVSACIIASCYTYSTKASDTLAQRDYVYLRAAIATNKKDTVEGKLYARAWIKLAKSKSDPGQLCEAFRTMLYLVRDGEQMKYADSILAAARDSGDNILMGSAYLTRGALYYSKKNHARALDEFLLADTYISRTKNKYLEFKIKYVIAQSKYHLGFYDEAISLYRQCLPYFREENDRAYLNTVHALAVTYIKVGRHELAASMVALGESASIEHDVEDMLPYFWLADGMVCYHIGDHYKAIEAIQRALSGPVIKRDFANYATAETYLGRAFWEMGQYQKAIPHFKSADSIFLQTGYINPDLRDSYELMIGYYEQQGNKAMQLYYSGRLIEIDRIFERDYIYLSRALKKEYEDRKQSELHKKITLKMQSWKYAALVGCLILMGITGIFYTRNKHNRKKYLELMSAPPRKVPIAHDTKEIDDKLVRSVLLKLNEFEENHKYLSKDMSLRAIARFLGTNPRYASMIITKYRGKGYIQYLTDLKIDYIVHKLKTDRSYRNFTIKALTKASGFGSEQVFAKSFRDRTGIKPSYFCKRLRGE